MKNHFRSLTSMRWPLLIVGATGLTVFLALSAAISASAGGDPVAAVNASQNSEVAPVQTAATEAILAHQSMGAPMNSAALRPNAGAARAAAKNGATALSAPDAALAKGDVQQRSSAADAAFAKAFGSASSGLKAREQTRLNNVKALLSDPDFRFIDSGVSAITYDSTSVSGNTAVTVAHVVTWSQFQDKDQAGKWHEASPENTIIVTTTLSKSGSTWKVSDLTWTFATGSAP